MKLVLMCGPCAIESYEILQGIARELSSLKILEEFEFYFKASFDKANRTSLDSFRGIGFKEGLEALARIKEEFGFRVITDVHECIQVEEVSRVADIIQIPAFLCRQTDLIVEAARSSCIVNIKKGQFMSPSSMKHSVLKALRTRGFNEATYEHSREAGVWVTERGSSFGYSNLVVDMRALAIMREFAPVMFDSTHSVQLPSGGGDKSSGDASFIPALSRAAAAVGVDGFFIETHSNPLNALSDGANMVKVSELEELLKSIVSIDKFAKEIT